jgi:hypothetical protein
MFKEISKLEARKPQIFFIYPVEVSKLIHNSFVMFGYVLSQYNAVALGFAKVWSGKRWGRGVIEVGENRKGKCRGRKMLQ